MTKRICSGKTRPRQNIFLPLLVLLFLSIPIFSHAANSFKGKLVGVSDGDTLSVMHGGKAVKIRLHGIDCPERRQPNSTQAKQFTSDMAFGKEVEVRVRHTDRYDRIIGEVILPNGKNLSHELVGAGLAWWDRTHFPNDNILEVWEWVAQVDRRGLWVDQNCVLPWEWRQGNRPPSEFRFI